ncbi:MAG: trypsin-like peptidase domain-containing protein [Chitinophagales bacterium]
MQNLIKKLSILFIFTILPFTTNQCEVLSTSELPNLLKGVKYASLNIVSLQDENSAIVQEIKSASKQYFERIGFEEVATNEQAQNKLIQQISTYCDLVEVDFEFTHHYGILDNMVLEFHFCNNKNIRISFSDFIKTDGQLTEKLLTLWSKTSDFQSSYDPQYRLNIRHNPIKYSETTIQWLLQSLGTEKQFIEGIYQIHGLNTSSIYRNLRVAIFRNKTKGYDIIYLNGAPNTDDWKKGEIIGFIGSPIKNNGFISFSNVNWYFLNKKPSCKGHIVVTGKKKNQFVLSFEDSNLILQFSKNVPSTTSSSCNKIFSYGSGIALTSDGYIITNQHVIKNAKCIKVDTHDGQSYDAELVIENVEDDIAILKINDSRFQSLPTIVYSFEENQADIGEDIFTVGYPHSSKEREFKLRTGNITAQNGYNGDIDTYETSLNVQKGSSGGAAISSSGKLIGIVRSKHAGIDNISFIIKSPVLLKTINRLPNSIQLPKNNVLKNLKDLKEQVKLVKPFVFHIKSYK